MAKKSKKTAARYSELSKARKKKHRERPPDHMDVSVTEARESAEPEMVEKPVARQVTRPVLRTQTESKRGLPSYQYVRSDLKQIGILAGAMLLILIIFSFVLG